ncbi:hypothetical protein [Paenibacillus gansuensis]|uniref:Uncharacterized protein n=1 Tax=Paenibacillus gansuensis TaxID=306542 RepID=A0ABW5PHT0_9BACL
MNEHQTSDSDAGSISRGIVIGVALGIVLWAIILTAVWKYLF